MVRTHNQLKQAEITKFQNRDVEIFKFSPWIPFQHNTQRFKPQLHYHPTFHNPHYKITISTNFVNNLFLTTLAITFKHHHTIPTTLAHFPWTTLPSFVYNSHLDKKHNLNNKKSIFLLLPLSTPYKPFPKSTFVLPPGIPQYPYTIPPITFPYCTPSGASINHIDISKQLWNTKTFPFEKTGEVSLFGEAREVLGLGSYREVLGLEKCLGKFFRWGNSRESFLLRK